MESDGVEGIYELQRPVTNGGEKCNDSIIRQSQSFSVVHTAALNSLHDLNPLEEDVEIADLNAKLEETTEMLEEEDDEEHDEENEIIEEHILEEVEEEEDIMGETEILEGEEVDDIEAVIPDSNEVEVEINKNKTPAQVPKKRKNNDIEATIKKRDQNDSPADNSQDNLDCEQPTSSSRTKQTQDEEVDENQCRVCTTKDDLVSLFKKIEQSTVAEMLMSICPSVSIAMKDFLPQYICNSCLDNVVIAVLLKNQCESSEKEFRKKLSRHKNKIRRPTGYVTIDGPLDSDPASDEELNNDDEFKVSDVASATPDEDSYDTDSSEEKRARIRSSNPRRGRPKTIVSTPTFVSKNSIEQNKKPNIQRKRSSENESSDDEDNKHKRKRISVSDDSQSEQFQCDECEQVFTRKLSLVLHKKTHSEPIACQVCGRQFKMRGAYRTHLEKHKEGNMGHKCYKCKRVVASSAELRRHLLEEHHDRGEVMRECRKCKRTFSSLARLHRHQDGRCPASETRRKQDIEAFAMGKDLFKSVAPLTTTYWSDSFSD
ncbi:uncharacterized zinc finger protein CG2678 isoform X1 [Glossina fuscipes]|uniref:Uncharacterized zinc finger protein CG2678 isoform X1 n=1 Tax=Glossina fuscipes TaxID=7396 RepID=A0A9C6DNA9_9MUSC|nr:uncharacterized zinc finger protein CG2678 isoform X1 [Glossina fuscipes]KAI9577863.1 hypothetical protein GQX74_011050 [Glossina fuscipes]